MKNVTRRDFIKKSVLGTSGITIGGMGLSSKSYSSVIGAGERINIAVIGCGGRGGSHVRSWCSLKDTQNVLLKTICDADELRMAEKARTAEDSIGIKPLTEWDMRRIFDDKDINDGFYSSALPAMANISYRLGRSLKYDNKTGRFVSDPEADNMLTRNYRKPYVVPDKV